MRLNVFSTRREASPGRAASLLDYVRIARPDHWFKNIFIVPGTLIAALFTGEPLGRLAGPFLIGLAAACLIASANYVINEWLDAAHQLRLHPSRTPDPRLQRGSDHTCSDRLRAHYDLSLQ